MIDLENQLAEVNIEIKKLDELATNAYKSKDLDLEKKYDAEMIPLKNKRSELRQKLSKEYETTQILQKGVLDKYENSDVYVSLIGKICWVTQPLIRQITHENINNKDLIYLKLDGTDGFTGKTQQIKIYLLPSIAVDFKDGIINALHNFSKVSKK